jgi:hypothetical protein
MTREQQLESCNLCQNRSFNPAIGTICGLTNAAATFDGICPSFIVDELEIESNERKEKERKAHTNKDINRGRYALFIIGGLYILAGYLEAYVIEGHDLIYGVIDWFMAAIFIGLGVWEKNPRAINFYKKNGFIEFDKHIFMLGEDEQIDCMMKLEIV